MIAEYLEHVLHFESLAAEAADPNLRETFLEQARAYRKLADERVVAQKIRLPLPPKN
jgi:hypothetical protein